MLQEYCIGKLNVVALPRNIRVTGEPGRITNPTPHPPQWAKIANFGSSRHS